ncbi:MAG: electron transfer flavoprotein subunit beta/FixA family protein [Deltaproteobacteria bacterium]|nr:electron transfer flavoprotein subunit beta/FixA family protein [Deltaproteobacteria bacterium]
MKLLVAAKRVPHRDSKIRVNAQGTDIVREGLEHELNPFDQIAVEEALRIREQRGGEVLVVAVGPEAYKDALRFALAMGADRGLLVRTDGYVDADMVARVFASVAAAERPDLILLGKQAPDDDANQVGQLLAGYLRAPQATFASKIVLDEDGSHATVTREVDGGLEMKRVALPAVVTADLRLNEPRYLAYAAIKKAMKIQVEERPLESFGPPQPRVRVLRLASPAERSRGVVLGSVEELAKKLGELARAE